MKGLSVGVKNLLLIPGAVESYGRLWGGGRSLSSSHLGKNP